MKQLPGSLKKLLPPNRIEELTSIGMQKQYKANSYFVREGEIPQKFAFVKQGLFRYYYINENGLEFTKAIILENNFISSYSAMSNSTESFFFIEALEDSEVFEIPFSNWQALVKDHLFWTQFLLKFVEKGFAIKEKRERDMLLLNAETRYKNFLVEFPNIDKRIKQTIIASYLGIQPESLSRIKKNMRT